MVYVPAAMPYVPGLLQQVFADLGVHIYTRQPPNWLNLLPFVIVTVDPVPDAGDTRFATRVVADVDARAKDDQDAHELADACRRALLGAQLNQTRYVRGVVNRMEITSQPAPRRLSDDPSGFAAWPARYRLTIRP